MNWEPLRTCPGPGSSSELRGTQSQEALEGLPLMESSLDLAPLGVPNSSLCPIGELSRILETDSCRCCRNHRNADSSLTSGRWPQLHGLWLSPALHLDRNLVSLLLLWYLSNVNRFVSCSTWLKSAWIRPFCSSCWAISASSCASKTCRRLSRSLAARVMTARRS